MSEMFITTGDLPTHLIDDYDFLFENGYLLPVSIDHDAGDSIVFGGTQITITLVSKPSPANPDILLQGEEIFVQRAHVLTISHRVKQVTELSPEQRAEWTQIIAKATGSIN